MQKEAVVYRELSRVESPRDQNVLNLIDFDGTIYYNPEGNLGTEINRENIIPYDYFPICRKVKGKNITNILLTGRHISQLDAIILVLENRGYHMNSYLLNPAPKESNPYFNPNADISRFFVAYWNWKLGVIEKYLKAFDIVNVIDDDEVVCKIAKTKGAHAFVANLKLEDSHLTISLKRL